MIEKPLVGQHAVVTGGGSGIGFAVARRLADLGASLTLLGRSVDRLGAAAAALEAKTLCDVSQVDVGDPDAVRRGFEMLDERGHVLRILVNNAGVAKGAKFAETDASIWEEMLRVNLSGVYHCIRAGLPRIVAAGGGRVVNVASTAGLAGCAYGSAYCAAKHGVIGLTRALAAEYALRGVTFNAVCPGYADTDMTRQTVADIVAGTGRSEADARAALAAHNPQRRLVTADEVGGAVAWLCLPEAAAINGQAISVSGGEVMVG
ncbi:MAG TPA: SDR family NAD(P)-dependent oxidoreductase [Casimicrobiaceae bacterium]|nr:SDR family NAD(P)-dependent oxidoreductase [Casimicrobiaceae bacterium]